jgi:hypothetical protein
LSQFIFRCHLKTQDRSGPQVLFKSAIKYSVKIRPDFWTFLPICNTRCCIRSPAWPTYSTSNGTRVLTRGATFRDFRGERQSQPCTFRSCGAESSLRPSAWCLRNPPQASGPPVLPTDRRQVKTCDSRADEISSFQPPLLGSHYEIIMHVHGTSV